VGRPVALCSVRLGGSTLTEFYKTQYSVSSDGRFLINELVNDSADLPITLILNWAAPRK
jgi:hypothetical protein